MTHSISWTASSTARRATCSGSFLTNTGRSELATAIALLLLFSPLMYISFPPPRAQLLRVTFEPVQGESLVQSIASRVERRGLDWRGQCAHFAHANSKARGTVAE